IAVRIARTLREMGIASVAVYSEADRDAPHVAAADEAVHIGPPMPTQSYLDQDRVVAAARQTGAEAIHPGYGFLSENADFAQRCVDEGIVFIGPTPAAIRAMGSKIAARQAAKAAGVPIVPGTETPLADAAEIAAVAGDLGYPVAIKAAAGGGGYGMRVVRSADEIEATLAGVQRDAQRAFGDTTVYVEKFFSPAPRHIEIQILGDRFGRVVHLGERECSLQRRFQKIVEETPSPAVSAALRERMGAAAVALAKAIGYVSAGTIECLVDEGGEFYFLEMNTRLQVEHPVTELVTGVDLVREMVRIAAGEPLSMPDGGTAPRGHAIEARIYAEDPAKNFMPSPGEITAMTVPAGPNIRIDAGAAAGSNVSVYYDPLIAKLIVWGDDRAAALATMRDALARYEIEGVKTNLPFLRRLFADADVEAGRISTRFVDERLAAIMAG
ncbi:MAG TPA: biotin carboxylase N-terminal domain-containing protein, partial [Thermomicrobiales bacterium]|nr:biotin carboxylase N-terminal domain-containing protein [Thermomicrobiales bacterium]